MRSIPPSHLLKKYLKQHKMIYKLRSDRFRYLNFYIEPYDVELILGDYFLLDELEWVSFWKPLNGCFSDDSDNQNIIKIPDITVWGNHNCLVLNQTAYECLQTHLRAVGELLPITSEGISYWLFHSTKKPA